MMGTEMLGTMGLPVKKLANAAAVKKSDLSNLTQNGQARLERCHYLVMG